MTEIVRLDPLAEEDRFARFKLMSWWDQSRLDRARILVIGAGALGNEILKTLALLGIGNVFIADLDRIENSNLSRSVLFREADCGQPKAAVAAGRAREIYPGMRVQPFHGNIVYDLGLGIYRWADVILGGLDNREARVAINQSAARAGRIWIDGAIERLDGVARVFDPATGPCYECTMSETDWKMLEARRSCALLTRAQMEEGKVPTTPTTAAIVAGIQCQEAIKLLHGLEVIAGKGFVFEGYGHQSYLVEYTHDPDCPSHDPLEPVIVQPWRVADTTVRRVLDQARADLGADAVLETNQDLLAALICEQCTLEEVYLSSLGKVDESAARCPRCQAHRAPKMYHTLSAKDEHLLDRAFAELGLPAWDIVAARAGGNTVYYEFQGDRADVLGALQC